MMRFIFYCLLFSTFFNVVHAQCTQPANLQNQVDIPVQFPLMQHNMTARRDTSPSKPYLYVAGKERGLVIYNISNLASPVLTASILPSAMQNLDVMSITQSGNYLYLALGDFFNANAQHSGMAIVDISTPSSPVLKSTYSYSLNSGAGHVAVDGNYAYVSAMQNGILVLDVSNKTNIQLLSTFKPSIHFPKVNPNSSEQQKINVRQITVKNNILYVCYDAGGLRIVNATNKYNLVETGRYANPLLNARPRAYNNLVLNDTLVYIAVDYCGMEIIHVKDTTHLTQIGWWNPWNCQSTSNTWFNSPGHANEIEYDANCQLLFLSTGRSDMHVVNVSNPAAPDSCSRFGNTTDSLGTWGLGHYGNQIYLAYIATWPLYTPFPGNWSGIKIITYNNACAAAGIRMYDADKAVKVYPNPACEEVVIELDAFMSETQVIIYNAIGQKILEQKATGRFTKLNIREFQKGLYTITVINNHVSKIIKFVKQ
ncbi:MAG: T9SS type A sorting domain-containing protein [Bacteroidetes bacterium]|nr:T9SS type A sorting domain-containing protein [Bacteroidota bacterium]